MWLFEKKSISSTFSRNNNIITYLYYLPQIKVCASNEAFHSNLPVLVVLSIKEWSSDCQPLGGLQGLQAWKKEFS
ncbi:hypothetical protein Taro_053963 [Colocasia esculenta]|uniref:Uncharacterized protein n=1 Tax=Colocasia esculenta TaxID=4460 RepID=A0A843XP35_COLES|nr:hypothetical protein [Colocasia esculenta]